MKFRLKICGMDCISCSRQVSSILKRIKGIESAKVNFSSSSAEIESISFPDLRLIEKKLSLYGYSLPKERVLIKTDKESFERVKEDVLQDIKAYHSVEMQGDNLLLSLYPINCKANDISGSFKKYDLPFEIKEWESGVQESIEKEQVSLLKKVILSVVLTLPFLWNPSLYLQFALATLILLIPGSLFLKRAIRSVYGGLNMDVLILLSSCLVYAYSSYLAFTVKEDIKLYFLCEGVLISLVLFGRYLEVLVKGGTEKLLRGFVSLLPHKARVILEEKETLVDIDEVKVQDTVLVLSGERIPNDGLILEGEGLVDESLLTGESLSIGKKKDDFVFAGTFLREGKIKINVTRIGKETSLEQMIELVSEAQVSSSPIKRLADKIVSIFIPCVIGIGFLVFSLYYFVFDKGNVEHAILCLAGVLVVSCPCALGLALPTSIMIGSGKASQLGVLFKNASAIEKMNKIKIVAFDKTGTLTFGGEDSSRNLLRNDVSKTIKELSKKYKVVMISGDKEEIAKEVAKKAGISYVYSEVKAEGKARVIEELKKEGKVMMIGDGLNDGPALAVSDLSVSIQNGTDLVRDTAEIIILGDDIAKLPLAFDISKKIMRNIYENLAWATLYNAICIPLAAIGLINPSLASAAMSLLNSLRLNNLKGKEK